jgi:hypothetical protein
MSRERGQTEKDFIAHLWVDGVDCGVWDSHDGADLSANNSSRRVSGGITVQLGGTTDVSPVKLTRLHRSSLRSNWDWLRTRVNKGEVRVTLQEKDADGHPVGEAIVHTGVLGDMPGFKYDETSNAAVMQEVTINVDSVD